jgi:hypothetical protein
VEILLLELSEKEAVYLAPAYGGRKSASVQRQFTISEGMGDRQLHNVLLDVTWQERFDGGLPPGVGELTAIDQSQEAMTCKAAQVTPQPPIVEACLTAVLRQCTLLLQDRANRLIAR